MKKTILCLIMAIISVAVIAQDYTQVYLIGGAAPNGWSNDKAEAMMLVSSDDESAVFTWTGALKASDFKFINTLGTWQPSFNAATPDEPIILGETHSLVYNASGDDHKFTLPQAGFYTVIIDLKKLTMVVTEAEMELPEELWVVGSAIPNGIAKLSNAYGIANFLYVGELLEGDFKIITTESINEFTQYIVPLEEDVDITGETTFIITNDATVPGWNVWAADPVYKIKINLVGKKSNAEIFESRDKLYIVGGAVEIGWNAGLALPFVKDLQNPDVFIFDGELKIRPEHEESNLFKILGQLDWNPYSLHPYNPNEPLLESKNLQISVGDNKWAIDEDKQGRYILTVNTLYETIDAQYIGNGSSIQQVKNNRYFQILSMENGIHISMSGDYLADAAQLISIDGRIVNSIRNAGKDFVVGNNITSGVYILKIDCNKKHFVQRVFVK
ncbi:SusF/SusE family outer membrane protein [Dysgonomonas sp. 520]|uniref:SusF/SusE family outer membrane protein n=1 Tax=Dysgonomonas sp. 520 TaxID=2302931 RepID=UPI0013D2123B|nr:SusF/SusE family outer membrane protein [Dysgonomonas sp. 520]NDW11047.1 SusF/SusE family outer membrane protein [Dysgonomonas sp. 520]